MIEALLFWGLAMYGALVLVWQTVTRILRKDRRLVPMNIVLLIQNAEREIEGTLRGLMVKTSLGTRERRIIVLDLGSTDETQEIVGKMAEKHHCLEYVRVAGEEEALQQLRNLTLQNDRVSCIYNLNVKEMLLRVTDDAVCLFQ